MEECSSEDGLKLLSLAGINLPNNELDLFKTELDILHNSSGECYNFVESVWKVYSEILPYKAYPEDVDGAVYRKMARDNVFQERVVNSGISKELESGKSLKDLILEKNKGPSHE